MPLRLGSLRSWHILRARCTACGHWRTLDVAGLRRRLGDAVSLRRLEARLRCGRCGNGTGNVLEIGCYARDYDPDR